MSTTYIPRPTAIAHELRLEDVPRRVLIAFARRTAPDAVTDCLLFTGARNDRGYGIVRLTTNPTRLVLAHRLAVAIALGVCPADREVHHACEVRGCVNVDHLRLVTGPENEAAKVDPLLDAIPF